MRQRTPGTRLRRGAYLLPSLFTVGNIVLGFYAMVAGWRGEFRLAVLLIFIAAFVDSIDGRLARVTQTSSDFGREYDSLADVITFGVVPAWLAFLWGLNELGRIGWFLPLFYLVCTATRLARFNVQTRISDPRFFVGLPAPAAAAVLGSMLFFLEAHEEHRFAEALLLFLLAALGLLMVSSFRYYSFKELDPRRRLSYRVAIPILLVVLLALLHPAAFFLVVSGTYAASGPALWLRGRKKRPRTVSPVPDQASQPDEEKNTP